MAPPVSHRPSPRLRLLVHAAVLLLMAWCPAASAEPETCFSRQHVNAVVNVRLALSRPTTLMDGRAVRSERDCVLACCSEEVKPGARCNMAVFNANKHADEDNCFLFHCQAEPDCPLMKAQEGINTHDIYKGLNHPTTGRPTTTTTTLQPTTTTTTTTTRAAPATTTTTQPTTTTTTQAPPTTTQAPPTTTQAPPTTTQAPPTTTQTPPTTTQAPPTTTQAPPTTTQAPPTTTQAPPTTTQAPATTTQAPPTTKTQPIVIIATMTPESPSLIAVVPGNRKQNKTSKKQNKTTKKGKGHPTSTATSAPSQAEHRTTAGPQPNLETTSTVPAPTTTTTTTARTTTTTTTTTTTPLSTTRTSPAPTTSAAAPPMTTTTTTPPTTTTVMPSTTTTTTTLPTTTTTTPTTTSPPTTTTTSPPTTTTTTPAASLAILPKDAVQADHTLQNAGTRQGKAVAARGAIKSSVVAVMVLGLAMLTLALAVGGRKAMESFDRRHYTRLELNDLHYEV